MIVFKPKEFFLSNIDNVEICLDNNGVIKTYPMEKKEDGKFIFSPEKKYTNFFFKSKGKIYCQHKIEYAVIATMSSGKSTFINALLGREIMPSENTACTNRVFKLENALGKQNEEIKIKRIGKISRVSLDANTLRELNNDENIEKIDIQIKYPNINNNISLYDTPGVNSFENKHHKEITYTFLKETKIKNIIYILNATQIAVNDDKYFLLDLEELKEEKNVRILFVLNKIDEINEEIEKKEDIIKNVQEYLKENGFFNYHIYPLSALEAKLIRKALFDRIETRAELNSLQMYYQKSEIVENEGEDEFIEIKGRRFSKNKLLKMLEATGIIDIERAVQDINKFLPTFSLRVL